MQLDSQETPGAGRIVDLNHGSLFSVVSRLSGIGQVNVDEQISNNNLYKVVSDTEFLTQLPIESTRLKDADESVFEDEA